MPEIEVSSLPLGLIFCSNLLDSQFNKNIFNSFTCSLSYLPSLVTQLVKSPLAMHHTLVLSLGQEDPLEMRMATHSSILAWKIPWTEETSELQSMGLHRVRHDWGTNTCMYLHAERGVRLSTILYKIWVFLMAQMVKTLPEMWETWVQSLGWENPLEKSMTPLYSSEFLKGKTS